MIEFTQGDSAVLNLTAVDANNNPIDLTGAAFVSAFRGPQGLGVFFDNSHHVANPDQVNFRGQYTLSLSTTETPTVPIGDEKGISTQITIGSSVVYYHGEGICNVLSPIPIQ